MTIQEMILFLGWCILTPIFIACSIAWINLLDLTFLLGLLKEYKTLLMTISTITGILMIVSIIVDRIVNPSLYK